MLSHESKAVQLFHVNYALLQAEVLLRELSIDGHQAFNVLANSAEKLRKTVEEIK